MIRHGEIWICVIQLVWGCVSSRGAAVFGCWKYYRTMDTAIRAVFEDITG